MAVMLRSFLFLLIVMAVGCATSERVPGTVSEGEAETPASDDVIRAVGTIQYVSLEGGFFGIVADDGTRYNPLNLDDAFRQDGLRVQFTARPREDVVTVQMWGQPVEIVRMVQLPEEQE